MAQGTTVLFQLFQKLQELLIQVPEKLISLLKLLLDLLIQALKTLVFFLKWSWSSLTQLPNAIGHVLQSRKEHVSSFLAFLNEQFSVIVCFEWFLELASKAILYIQEQANYIWAGVLSRINAFCVVYGELVSIFMGPFKYLHRLVE